MGWTLSTAWSSGRRAEVETFSGSGLPTVFGGGNTSSTGIVRTDIDVNRTLVTDQAGKRRISVSNAIGQLKEVWEILAASETGSESVSFPNTSIAHAFKTTYSYDTLNNLTTVNQGSQTRTFTYSSLSRLLSAANPESGTISYEYDPNGNLIEKNDARNIVTTYTYDALNRVTARDYDDSTPDVVYTYGTSAPKVGKLVKVQSSVSTTEYTGFDILGRVTSHKQTTDGNQYTTGYTYSLIGALLEQTYPSGRVVKNTYDAADGSISQVQSKRSSETYRNFANGFVYNPAGAVTAMRLGNGKWENTVFNSRLQPTQIGLGNGVNSQNLLKLAYSYGTTANNGNVQSQTITVPGVTHPFIQNYTYDELNRLKIAEETQNSTQTWKQTFTFDRYGNRNFDEANTTTRLKNCGSAPNYSVCSADVPIVNPSVNTANNKLNGTTYDAAGNVIEDAEGRQFTYDAENKQVEVENGSSQLIGQYYFDGDGKRVKKVVPSGETTIFVYDASGRLIGEYSTEVQPSQDAKTQYLTTDHLGTPRMNTNSVGTVVSRSDYMPYGEEIISGRSSGQGYVTDDVRQGFTGYENDGETGLDYAQARMYRNSLGRFTTTDPVLMEPNRAFDPQRINLYGYVRNNPLLLVDPTGQIIDDSSLKDDEKYQRWKAALLATEAGRALWAKYHDDKNFTLVIKHDPKRDNGALTDNYKFKDGKLVGATISLGNDIGDRGDASKRNADQYPLTQALGAERVDSELLGAAVLAHEFGHVEDANNRAALFQQSQEYADAVAAEQAKGRKLVDIYSDPAIKQKAQSVLAAFGAKSWDDRDLDTDNRAERTAIPVIQQSYANRGKSIPKGIQNAINKLTGVKK